MSYDIDVQKTKEISVESLLNTISQKDVQIGYSQIDSINSPLNGFLNLYKLNQSTRGVTLNTTSDSHSIIINAIASEKDYLLAKDITIGLAKLSDSLIKTESEDNKMTIEQFENTFSNDWINKIKTGSASTFKEAIKMNNEWINLPCCVRSFYFGNNTIAEINCEDDEIEFYNRLCERIRKVQFLDKSEIRIPEIGQLKGDESTLIIFNKEEKQFIPKVDFIYINDGEVYKIPKSEFIQSESIQFERLDEEQYIASNINPSNFHNLKKEFVGRIQKTEKKQPPKKKWKFW